MNINQHIAHQNRIKKIEARERVVIKAIKQEWSIEREFEIKHIWRKIARIRKEHNRKVFRRRRVIKGIK